MFEVPRVMQNLIPSLIVIERRPLLRGIIVSSVRDWVEGEIRSYGSLGEMRNAGLGDDAALVLLSLVALTRAEANAEIALISEYGLRGQVMVVGDNDDSDAVLATLKGGAKGVVSTNAEFPGFLEVLKFVAAGGVYIPPQSLLKAKQTDREIPVSPVSNKGITRREFAVVRAIQRGKPNKEIAYELNMCESTVKVHVRNVMRKLRVHNRTEIAIMGASLEQETLFSGAGCKLARGPGEGGEYGAKAESDT